MGARQEVGVWTYLDLTSTVDGRLAALRLDARPAGAEGAEELDVDELIERVQLAQRAVLDRDGELDLDWRLA